MHSDMRQTHHRLGISQALGQLSSKCFWQNQGQWAGYRAHHGRKKGLQHLFHLQTYLLNDLIAQEEILPSLHTHWRSLLLGRGKQETATRKANVQNHIFFWGHSLLILGIFRNQRNSVCRYLINLNNCSHFKINIGIVIWVWFSKIWYRPLRSISKRTFRLRMLSFLFSLMEGTQNGAVIEKLQSREEPSSWRSIPCGREATLEQGRKEWQW